MISSAKRPNTQSFLIEAATMLHRYGTPSHRLERVMTKVARSLGIGGEFLYTPTALVISLHDPEWETTIVRRIDAGPFDVDKMIALDQLLGRVERRELPVQSARDEMRGIDEARSLYNSPVYVLACAIACASIAVFFRGSFVEVLASAVIGILVALIELLHSRLRLESGLLEPIAGVLAALSALCIAENVVAINSQMVTLAGLIVLIPGLRLTVALTELAVGHLSAGVARLAGAMVSMATLFVGVALVWRTTGQPQLQPAADAALPEAIHWLALLVAPIAFAIVFKAGLRQWPIILLVSITGVVTSWTVEPVYGIEVAAFMGALIVGCGSNLYARIRDLPALVASTPGMLVLVPGSLGYRSLSALLDHQTAEGVQYGFTMFLIGVSLVGGLLVSNALVPPKRIL